MTDADITAAIAAAEVANSFRWCVSSPPSKETNQFGFSVPCSLASAWTRRVHRASRQRVSAALREVQLLRMELGRKHLMGFVDSLSRAGGRDYIQALTVERDQLRAELGTARALADVRGREIERLTVGPACSQCGTRNCPIGDEVAHP